MTLRAPALVVVYICGALLRSATAQSVDGGRSELPGMKRDMFDQVGANGKPKSQPRGKGPPECPRSDKMSPFAAIAFTTGGVFIKVNASEPQCRRLISLGGVNYSQMINASRTCGPPGEWKRRIAENMSSVFFQGGFNWVTGFEAPIEIVTEDGTFETPVNEEKYEELLECWKYGCGCEQAKNPIMRAIIMALFCVAVVGLTWDSGKVAWQKIRGKKPLKHVECKHGHRMEKVKLSRTHTCDICGCYGTLYQCCANCNYDMCKKCYAEQKATNKAELAKWYEKHPEDKPKKKEGEDEEKEEDDDKADDSAKSGTEAETDCPTPKTEDKSDTDKSDTEGKEKTKTDDAEEKEGKEKTKTDDAEEKDSATKEDSK